MSPSIALLVFARVPIKGKVKTRLAADIGADQALEVYEELLLHTANVVRKAALPTFVYVDQPPESAHPLWTCSEGGVYVQNGATLGDRLALAFNQTWSKGFERIMVIGTDCPGISDNHLQEAAACLGSSDAVIGPSTDGGYYLIGLSRPYAAIWEQSSWSTPNLLDDTVRTLQAGGRSTQLLETLPDVDVVDDLRYLKKTV